MIKGFKCKATEKIHQGQRSRKFAPDLVRRITMRLDRLDAAVSLDDLRFPPSHCLEPLIGDRAGQHSIRINKQWQLCFVWSDDGVFDVDVEVVDYH
jgi:proteic killer suppression protein